MFKGLIWKIYLDPREAELVARNEPKSYYNVVLVGISAFLSVSQFGTAAFFDCEL